MKISEFLTYLSDLGHAHNSIKSVVMGDYEDIISKERTTIEYPCLWIETPTVLFYGDNDAPRQIFQGSLVVLHNNNNVQDPKVIRQNLESTFEIAREFLYRMTMKDQLFSITNRRLDAIATLGNDDDQGWRFEFEIETDVTADQCYDASHWTEPQP